MRDMIMQMLQGAASQPSVPVARAQTLNDLMMGAGPTQIGYDTVPQAEYDAIMEKVRKGKPRSDYETQRLQQYNMDRQQAYARQRQAQPQPNPVVPTHKQMGGPPRAIVDPFGMLADAMKGH